MILNQIEAENMDPFPAKNPISRFTQTLTKKYDSAFAKVYFCEKTFLLNAIWQPYVYRYKGNNHVCIDTIK